MENASEAIAIAAAVLIFVTALTIGISSFSNQTSEIDAIVEADERTEEVQDSTGKKVNYIYSDQNNRKVGVDTIVNTLYRAYKENYTVYINLEDSSYNPVGINKDGDYLVFKITTEYNLQNAKEKLNNILQSTSSGGLGLYDKMKDNYFTEYIGEVYQDDIKASPTDTRTEIISDANKTKIRIITYIKN